jgi:hypothetical protein
MFLFKPPGGVIFQVLLCAENDEARNPKQGWRSVINGLKCYAKKFFDGPLDAFFRSTRSCPSRPKGLGKSVGDDAGVMSMLLHGGCGYANF